MRGETFDDDENDSLVVLSGSDVLSIHYGHGPDEDKAEERSAIDKRRGLVLAQVAVLEDLVDEIIIYLDDPVDADAYRKKLPRMLGPRGWSGSRNFWKPSGSIISFHSTV